MPAGVTWPEQKQLTNEAIYKKLARDHLRPQILCGDFNSPRSETREGQLIPHGSTERWKAAETATLTGLAEYGMVDVFRDCHGYGVDARTYTGNREGSAVHRYDHAIASEGLKPWTLEYRHAWRTWKKVGGARQRLSDHSGVVFSFTCGQAPRSRR